MTFYTGVSSELKLKESVRFGPASERIVRLKAAVWGKTWKLESIGSLGKSGPPLWVMLKRYWEGDWLRVNLWNALKTRLRRLNFAVWQLGNHWILFCSLEKGTEEWLDQNCTLITEKILARIGWTLPLCGQSISITGSWLEMQNCRLHSP